MLVERNYVTLLVLCLCYFPILSFCLVVEYFIHALTMLAPTAHVPRV